MEVRNGSAPAALSAYEVTVGTTGSANGGPPRTQVLATSLDGTVQDDTPYMVNADGVTAFPSAGSSYAEAIGPFVLIPGSVPAAGTSFVQVDKTVNSGADADGDGLQEQVIVRSVVEVVGRASLTVAAGRFSEVLHLRTTVTETVVYSRSTFRPVYRTVQDDWYAADVGLIRSERTESINDTLTGSSLATLKSYRVNGNHAGVGPLVTVVQPDDGRVHNGAVAVQAVFDAPMSADSLNRGGFSVQDGNGLPVAGNTVVSADGLAAVFVPSGGWRSGSFTARIGSPATDRNDVPMVTPRSWSFTLDTVAPSLAIASPADGATNVRTDTALNYVFSEQIDTSTVTSAGLPLFTLTDDSMGTAPPATLSYDSVSTVSIRPRNYWSHDTRYTLTFPAGTADLLGNAVGSSISIHFSTAPGAFGKPVDMGVLNGNSVRPLLEDLDGDGRTDLVWSAWDNTVFPWVMRFYLRRGLADGSWAPISHPIPDAGYACHVTSLTQADLNADGRQDLVVGGMCGLQTLLQQPDGTFAVGERYVPTGMETGQYAALGDLNGDGRIDMVTGGNGDIFQVWLQDSTGRFVYTISYNAGGPPRHLIDLDGDGHLDLLIEDGPKVFWGQGNGTFSAPQTLTADPLNSPAMEIGDVDRDGRLDVVTMAWSATTGQSLTQVIRQTAARTFAAPWRTEETPKTVTGMTLMDADGDGRLDVVTGYMDAFSVRSGRGDGTFEAEDFYDAPLSDLGNASITAGPLDNGQRRPLLVNGMLYGPRTDTPTPGVTSSAATASLRRTQGSAALTAAGRESPLPGRLMRQPPMFTAGMRR